MKAKHIFLGAFLLVIATALAACGGRTNTAQETVAPTLQTQAAACPTAAPCPTPVPQEASSVGEVPFEEAWLGSPHADTEAEAFVHWNEEDPQEIPANCARCHSTPGYLDYIGEDGSTPNQTDNPAPVGTVITCAACHNATTAAMTSVIFPSGSEITGLSDSARCMQCHQGRASKVQVDEALAEFGADQDLDTVPAAVEDETLGFINIHYYAAAATMYGTMTKGGYEYDGKTYDSKFQHVEGYDSCAGCHNPHTTELKVEQCAACHGGVASREDLKNIRMFGSLRDYDGDGDTSEGIAFEIEGLQGMLLQAIQAYAKEKAGAAIGYNAAAHPYFFVDSNEDGEISEDEAVGDNQYQNWTGRLLKAAYNYQVSVKDPGAYAHGGKYIIELLYDSIEDLNTQIGTPVDLTAANRTDAGHFAGSEEPFRHWDSEEEGGLVPGECAKCHTGEGLPMFLGEASRARDQVSGVNIAVAPTNGLNCSTCHTDMTNFESRYQVAEVKFPSGAILSFGAEGEAVDANLCIECHQGRESKVSIDRAIAATGLGDDEPANEEQSLSFRNPHYFAAGATLFGTQAKGAYEFDGQEYNGRFMHVQGFQTCVECHDAHALTVNTQACSGCHSGVESAEDLRNVRMDNPPVDYDGDGDTTEGIAGEIQTMHETLYAAIQAYASGAGTPIQFNGAAYPYFFQDPNENGELDDGEEGFTAWTPNLLRASYNLTWVAKDPGAFAHNGRYILQILYDSLNAVGGDTAGMTRPPVQVQQQPEATETP